MLSPGQQELRLSFWGNFGVAITTSHAVVITVMLITAYVIELALCLKHCSELDMLCLIYLIYLTTTHLRKIVSRTGLIKFKSEYDSNYGKAMQRRSSLKAGG